MWLGIVLSSAGSEEDQMICCICGEVLELGDLLIQVTQFRLGLNQFTGQIMLVPFPMEDGSETRMAHTICPIAMGAPLSLVGADMRNDV